MNVTEPSMQSWQLFCAVELDAQSISAAAKKAGVTESEAKRLLAEAAEWFKTTTPAWAAEMEPALRPIAICRLHDERLQQIYTQLMQAWRASRGEEVTRHQRGMDPGSGYTKTITSHGQVRYLAAAARISLMQITAAERLVKLMEKQQSRAAAATACSPPVRTCAPVVALEQETLTTDAEAVDLNDFAKETCDDVLEPDLSLTAPKIDCVNPVRAQFRPPLNRKQKRALERRKRRLGV